MNPKFAVPQDNSYHILRELGAGAQGAVYLVKNAKTKKKFAAKIVNTTSYYAQYSKHDRFLLEEEIMQRLKGVEGFPQIQDITEIDEHDMLVMQVLGDNLRTLKDRYEGRLSTLTCLQIMHQIVRSRHFL